MNPGSSSSDEIRRFEEQYRRNPDSLVFARLADAYRKAGEPERALDLLEDGIARHEEYLSAHIVKARVLRDLGQRDEAAGSYRRVLELDGQNLVAVQELASLALERGDLYEARAWYELLTQIDPLNRPAREQLYALLSELDAAAGELEAAVGAADEKAAPDSSIEVEPDAEPEAEPDAEPEADTEADAAMEIEADAAMEIEAEAAMELGAEAAMEIEAEADAGADLLRDDTESMWSVPEGGVETFEDSGWRGEADSAVEAQTEAESALRGEFETVEPGADSGAEGPAPETEPVLPEHVEGWWEEFLPDDDTARSAAPDTGIAPVGPVPEEVHAGADAQAAPAGDSAWWYEDATAGAGEVGDDADVLTRTMADLYLKQGLLDEALEIYEELLKDHPEESDLRSVVEDLRERVEAAQPRLSGDEAAQEAGVEPAELTGLAVEGDSAIPAAPLTGEDEIGGVQPAEGPPLLEELRDLLREGAERAATAPDILPAIHEEATGPDPGTHEVAPATPEQEPEPAPAPERSTVLDSWLRGLEPPAER